ncbi:hypothetical protein E5357_06700 [Hominisplanchenecus murintestinalis]|uniref:Uncharacterized protein n=1 Tax=Hominisplanchenecus murintestinalis TaxID=2941517 RepID=A0AC61R0Y1_9FIRM|nr:hypothetical protein E5357_06700 [Hominisplanchenecus murintestinalis]
MYEAVELFNEYAMTICIRRFATRCRKVAGIKKYPVKYPSVVFFGLKRWNVDSGIEVKVRAITI